MSMKRIVLAYSGGLETSAAIPWLSEHFSATSESERPEIIAVMVDVGRKPGLVEARARALALGARRCHVVDARDEFVRDYVLPTLQAGALSDDRSPLPSALSRPLIARKIVDVARMEKAAVIAHGVGWGYDGAPLDVLIRSVDASFELIAPAQVWDMSSAALLAYAASHGITPSPPPGGPHQVAANVWGRSIAFDPGQDPWTDVPEDVFDLTRAAEEAPDQAAYLDIEFERGMPTRVNGIEMLLLEMLESLETIAGAHGIGRTDTIVSRPDGTKYREICEAPAVVVLHTAHRELEQLLLPSDLTRLMQRTGRTYADLIHTGRWFSETREALDAFTRSVQSHLSGTIRLRLFKGDCRVAGRAARGALKTTS
jgi:argininosuccinate synthase